ncbi:MAG: hypothetical protein FWG40_01620 [Peptococcaceae bacterium]|nr:hypothetical protein [Peptococcaceae bacterium]
MLKKILLITGILVIFSSYSVFAEEYLKEAIGNTQQHDEITNLLEQKTIRDYRIITDPLRSHGNIPGFAGNISDEVIDSEISFGNVRSLYSFSDKIPINQDFDNIKSGDFLEQIDLYFVPVLINGEAVGIAMIQKDNDNTFYVLGMSGRYLAKMVEDTERSANELDNAETTELFLVYHMPYFIGIIVENSTETFAIPSIPFLDEDVPLYSKASMSQILPEIIKTQKNFAPDSVGGRSSTEMNNQIIKLLPFAAAIGLLITLAAFLLITYRVIKKAE